MITAPQSVDCAIPTSLSVRDLIERQAGRYPDRVFLIDPDANQTITFNELRQGARSIAAALNDLGIETGESVAYALSNGRDCALTVLGILYGGFRATAINLVAGAQAIGYVLEHSETRLIITEPVHNALLDQALEGCGYCPPRLDAGGLVAAREQDRSNSLPGGLGADSDGLLMYTSGTTGEPKGVVLTHENLVAGGRNAANAHELVPDDRALCVLPLYHINGLCVTLIGPLVSGGSVVMPGKFSASAFWGLLRDNACSWFSVVPTQISYLLHDAGPDSNKKAGLEHVRFGRSASAPLAPEVQMGFEDSFGIPIIETMGLTETAAQILSNPLPPATRKSGSPGVAIGNDVMIADGDQKPVPNGQEGELLVRGANVMRLYFKNEEATKAAQAADGWLRTGDLGRMDEEGYVFITGRLKELIIKGGENIAPREIDEALYACPLIVEAAAFACPCEKYGQTVEAAVAVSDSATITEGELMELCRQRLGPFKTPDRIHFLAELPKGPSGKIQRSRIAEVLERHKH